MLDVISHKDQSQLQNSVVPGSTEYWSTNKYSGSEFYQKKSDFRVSKDAYMRGDTFSYTQMDKIVPDKVSTPNHPLYETWTHYSSLHYNFQYR